VSDGFNVDDVAAARPTFMTYPVGAADMVTFSVAVPAPIAEVLAQIGLKFGDHLGNSPERAIVSAIAHSCECFERTGWAW